MDEQGGLLREPITRVPLTVIDVETTGLNPVLDRVVEIALIRVRDGVVQRRFVSLVNPRRDIPEQVQMIHQITPAMVRDQPTFADLAGAVATYFEGGVVVGHNVGFDLGFVRSELRRAGMPELALPSIDTLQLARQYLHLSSYSLTAVARRLGLRGGGHRAMADASLTLEVFTRLVAEIGSEREPTLAELLQSRRQGLAVPPSGARSLAKATTYGPFRGGQRLRLQYHSPTSGYSERIVDVVEINVEYGSPSLYAYCHRSRDMRTFRIDRIVSWEEIAEESPAEV